MPPTVARWLAVASLLLGCAGAPMRERLPDGVYANPAGDQTITVADDQVAFHIELIGPRAGQVFDRRYGYRLTAGGHVAPHPVRDVDAVYGIGAFEFVWDGERILQHDRQTKALLQAFTRQERAGGGRTDGG